MPSLTRRWTLKAIGFAAASLGLGKTAHAQKRDSTKRKAPASIPGDTTVISWSNTFDRVWLSGKVWANPMEDWRVIDGAAECLSMAGDRNVHLITHQLTDPAKPFQMSVVLSRSEFKQQDDGAGFKIGIKSELNEYRSNTFAKSGIRAGIIDGKLVLGNQSTAVDGLENPQDMTLTLTGRPAGQFSQLTLVVSNREGQMLGEIMHRVPSEALLGNIAIVSGYDAKPVRRQAPTRDQLPYQGGGSRYRFNDWTVTGNAFTVDTARQFGPILWSMYSLSDSRSEEGFVMKISALTGPLGTEDSHDVELYIQQDDDWKSLGKAKLDSDAWTATFRIANWNETVETPYLLVYREKHRSGSETESIWTGKIKANPVGRPLRIGALTCQNDYGFPYAPVAENLIKLDPDLLYFSGDQIYESHGGYGIIRDPAEPAILNYLRKFYQHGWAFREAMKDAPTICIPDDHDVFQGNIWGEGGIAMDVNAGGTSSNGGYRQPARMVNVVHKTNAAHHPDYHEPTPVKQDISVYYGDLVYGDVSFAIISDRQWKSGPQHVDSGSGRADHVTDPDFDTSVLDKPGLILLGERQEEFLKQWTEDWRGHSMKILLSQTVFAGVATHHGNYDGYLKADLDSGGWPQTPRDNAIRIIRKAMPLHINGDQHLTSLVQYGVDAQRDGFWSFCTPAISVGYPRWWRPDELGMPHQNRPQHGLEHTGEYLDGLGNQMYVYAIGNPEVGTEKNRYDKAHQKGSGFGLVTVDTDAKTYTLDAYRFLVDATDGNPENQFPGWPVTIHQSENGGDNRLQ